jgi:hypothetical protein
MSEPTIKGSCLCGAARYSVAGEAVRFYHCHCSRCRKASGTGHASNLFVQGSLQWDSGADQVQTFKLPEAERFTNTFCKTCGGRLPRMIEALGMVFIPAGSLDQEPAINPQARIFVGSRASWSCEQGPIPGFENYPE